MLPRSFDIPDNSVDSIEILIIAATDLTRSRNLSNIRTSKLSLSTDRCQPNTFLYLNKQNTSI